MARNFLSYPAQAYNGTPQARSFNDKRGNQKGIMVKFAIQWASYTVGNQSLGLLNPNFSVNCNLNNAGPGVVSQNWTIESCYIDNQGIDFPVYVFFPSTNFSISCPPNSAGWYQVFTIDRLAIISGIGIPTIDISNNVFTNVFFTDTSMVPYLDQEQQTAVQFGLASPLITFGGSGGSITGITRISPGANYSAGGLIITGGGGSGALAHGTLDAYGRFTSITVDNPGSGYSGPPQIIPSAAQNRCPVWVGQPFNQGDVCSYLGLLWYAVNASNGIQPGSNGAFWAFTGISSTAIATFNSTQSPILPGNSIQTSSSYNAKALGDQSQAVLDSVNAPIVFRHNLWGTPFSSGFIYLTNVYIQQTNQGAGTWQVDDAGGDVLWNFFSQGTVNTVFLNMQDCNIKLPATTEWRLNCTGVSAIMALSHAWNWTYSQS